MAGVVHTSRGPEDHRRLVRTNRWSKTGGAFNAHWGMTLPREWVEKFCDLTSPEITIRFDPDEGTLIIRAYRQPVEAEGE